MGGRDEDDPAHLRHRLVKERLLQEPAVVGRAVKLVDGPCADRLPEPGSARLDHHLRENAAQAVADDDHLVQGYVRAIRIEDPTCATEGLPQRVRREGDGVAARIAKCPELILFPEYAVGLEVLDHPIPMVRFAPEAMDQDDWDLAALVRSARFKPASLLPRPIFVRRSDDDPIRLCVDSGRVAGDTERGQDHRRGDQLQVAGQRDHRAFFPGIVVGLTGFPPLYPY